MFYNRKHLYLCKLTIVFDILMLTGESVSDTIIEQVFATFCVGNKPIPSFFVNSRDYSLIFL